jgi:hypothetical protein
MLVRGARSRAAKAACSPAAARLAARCFGRALLKGAGAALLIAMVLLQGLAENAARPNGFATLDRISQFGDQRGREGPFAASSGLLADAGALKGTAQQRANAQLRSVSGALAYVMSPPPATRGMLPRYLPAISPRDAQPLPSLAASAPSRRSAWRQAGRVRRPHGHQCRLHRGARVLAELPRPLHAQRAGSCRQERSVRRVRFHRHRLFHPQSRMPRFGHSKRSVQTFPTRHRPAPARNFSVNQRLGGGAGRFRNRGDSNARTRHDQNAPSYARKDQ